MEGHGIRKTPTEPMLKRARMAAERLELDLPDAVSEEFDACREWLDAHPVIPPSKKQIAYATRLSEEHDIELPHQALEDYNEMKKWLDAHSGGR